MNEEKRESSRVLAHSESSACSSACFAVGKNNYITKSAVCKEIFEKTNREVNEKYASKHILSEILSDSYGRLGYIGKSLPVYDCGSHLKFIAPIRKDGTIGSTSLYRGNFCKDRLCPTCAYRRELKVFSRLSGAFHKLGKMPLQYIFLTLTVRNVTAEELPQTISRMQIAFTLLRHRRAFKRACRGYFKALEVTVNNKRNSEYYGTFHPHFHIIIAVDEDYFKTDKYIKQEEFLEMWRESYNDHSIAFVNVEKIYSPKFSDKTAESAQAKAVCEVAKYTVKSSDYLLINDPQETDRRVGALYPALKGRRLIDIAGVFRKVLSESDVTDPDIETDDFSIDPELMYIFRRYDWHIGTRVYARSPDKVVSGKFLIEDRRLFAESHKYGQSNIYHESD